MNKEITNVWLQFLQNNLIVLSWGISQIKMTENSLAFVVNGTYYKGGITIECIEEKFDIYFQEVDIKIPSISVDDVVRVIDECIESNHQRKYFNQK